MRLFTASAVLASLIAVPAFAGGHASGDAAAGEKTFNQCKACHSITDADGNDIVKGGKTGPNLWGLPGRTAGTEADFGKYKDSIVAAGEGGLVWDEANFVAYVQDPNAFLKEVTGDSKARSGMAFRARKEEDAINVWAYIASVSPEPGS
ncbi:MAG: c-type cytochrome [Silicimonas sp.]|jgi:cytochrome c|nr:c-type cytochrome [Silicimonas sp.]